MENHHRTIQDLLDRRIYPSLDRAAALADLAPEDHRLWLRLTCPACGGREAFIERGGIRIQCIKYADCAYSKDIWTYIKDRDGLRIDATLDALARFANVEIPDIDPRFIQGYAESQRPVDRLEAVQTALQAALWSDAGEAALLYLRNRRYSDLEIRLMGLGYHPAEDFTAPPSGVELPGFEGRITLPHRDVSGRLTGFSARTLQAETWPKYLNSTGLLVDTPYYFHQVRPRRQIIVVEGYLDAMIAALRGVVGVTGIGGRSLTERQIRTAASFGVRSFILCLDTDDAGRIGTAESVERIHRVGGRAFIAALPEGYNDPDELFTRDPADVLKFETAVHAQAVSAAEWTAGRLIEAHSGGNAIDRSLLLEEAGEFDVDMEDPLDRQAFRRAIAEALELTDEELTAWFSTRRARVRAAALRDAYNRLFTEGLKLLEDRPTAEVHRFVQERLADIHRLASPTPPEPPTETPDDAS